MGQALAPASAANEVHYERRRPEETTLLPARAPPRSAARRLDLFQAA
ncbi:MAG: hypothetical protein ACKVP2_10920 [Burkholderiales bacterium]